MYYIQLLFTSDVPTLFSVIKCGVLFNSTSNKHFPFLVIPIRIYILKSDLDFQLKSLFRNNFRIIDTIQ